MIKNKKQTEKALDMRKLPAELKQMLKEERVSFVLDLMLKQWSSGSIQKAFAQKFNESERSARNYIKKVNDILAKEGQVDKDKQRALRIKQLEMIYREQIEEGNHKDAATTLNLIIKLEGTEAPKQQQVLNINHNTSDSGQDMFKHLSIEQKREVLKMLNPAQADDNTEDIDYTEES